MNSRPKILDIRADAHSLAVEQERIFIKLLKDHEWFCNQYMLEQDLNDSLVRAVSAASETLKAIEAYACVLEKIEPLMLPPDWQ